MNGGEESILKQAEEKVTDPSLLVGEVVDRKIEIIRAKNHPDNKSRRQDQQEDLHKHH